MTVRSNLLLAAAVCLFVAACDKPKGAPADPVAATPAAEPARPAPVRPAELVKWDESSGRFTVDGTVLKTAHLWRFDGSTEGFVAASAQVEPARGGGLRVVEQAIDTIVRSPQNLAIEGGRYNGVVVRLTREKEASEWDGSLFFSTPAHGETSGFFGKPLRGADPVAGETTIMVYDMAKLRKGGGDWTASTITGLRLDLDDQPGGQFVIHQIAVVALPASATLRPPQ
ncbi:hypothetical protein ACN2C7_01695 [Caulobacter sp. ErkDOM-E]|uniref:hypothetical protein n=1 Tax=Caulobacter sp. ErkDOM-E TaxID=3402778 RepID=UPI003AF5EE4E